VGLLDRDGDSGLDRLISADMVRGPIRGDEAEITE